MKVEVSVRSNINRNKSDLQYDDEIRKNVFCQAMNESGIQIQDIFHGQPWKHEGEQKAHC